MLSLKTKDIGNRVHNILKKRKIAKDFEDQPYCRERTLQRYSDILFLTENNTPSKGIEEFLKNTIEQKGYVTWIDLGCGNEIAQREAKILMEDSNINPNHLHTFGYDLLPLDENILSKEVHKKSLDTRLLNPKYSSIRFQEDIKKAQFPESPDLITMAFTLGWDNDDPLNIIDNGLAQLSLNGILCFNENRRLSYKADMYAALEPLFSYISENNPNFNNKIDFTYLDNGNTTQIKKLDEEIHKISDLYEVSDIFRHDLYGYEYSYIKKE